VAVTAAIIIKMLFQSGTAPYPPTYPSQGDFGKKPPHSMLQTDVPELRFSSDHVSDHGAVQNQTAEVPYPPPAGCLFVVLFCLLPCPIAAAWIS
jgi:hypothetical protein